MHPCCRIMLDFVNHAFEVIVSPVNSWLTTLNDSRDFCSSTLIAWRGM